MASRPTGNTADKIFTKAEELGASDVHIVVGTPIMFRIHGELEPQGKEASTKAKVEKFIQSILSKEEYETFQREKEIDASYSTPKGLRVRINCHFERGNPGLVARLISTKIPSLEALNLLDLEFLTEFETGIILFTGPTGSGKSSSLAAIIQHIIDYRGGHVVTLEDPIEFVFHSEKGLVRQRQFGSDFINFPEAMKRVLRQDPDIIMVGEMRDLETIAAALTLAETGHLVFGTLHTPNAIQTIDRVIDVFPPFQQQQIRTQLSMSLRAVVAQRLIPAAAGGRVAQREVLVNTSAVANIIRDNRVPELKSVLQTGKNTGMRTFEKDAKRLLEEELIDDETFDMLKKF